MTQSSENTGLDPSNTFGFDTLTPETSTETSPALTVEPSQKSKFGLNKPIQFWNNLPLRTKITTLLLVAATIPVIAVTQGILVSAKRESINSLQKVLDVDLVLLNDEIDSQKQQLEATANTLALSVQASKINPATVKGESTQFQELQSLITATQKQQPNASFYLITDNQGKTIAQSIQRVKGDLDNYPLLPSQEYLKTDLESVDLKPGISLKDVPIVNKTLTLSRPLSGFELLNAQVLQRLGLEQQALIGLRQQKIEGLSEAKKPHPEGTFDIDEGKAGFVLIATQPIKLANNEVGTAIVGTLVNRNFDMVDRLKDVTGVPTATIFAQDWRVSTNVPYTDKQTRAIGTRASREVANTVLNQAQVYKGQANIIGTEYLTGYSPLYDHNQQINAEEAKPIGIAYVGIPMTAVNTNLRNITLVGYGIGGGALLIFGVILILTPSDTGISRQLKQLTNFAGKVASGEPGVRLEQSDRQDEIGVLTRNLNEMAQNIETNLELRQQEAQQQRQEKEKLEQEIAQLLGDVGDAMDGDLTVRANTTSLEMSTVADLFNAIIDSLKDIAIQVKTSTTQVSSSLGDNEQSIQALAQQAIEEAEATRATLGSVEAMSHSIEAVATNANQAANLVNDTYRVTQEGAEAMDETVNSIFELRTTVGETAKKMKRLGESSQKISQVVSLIEEMALKTNLLAINASVEARRAGKQGEGFMIVAEQVGALAEQSAKATKEISDIVEAIQKETQEVTQAMELGTSQVVDSTHLVERTKRRLERVLERSQTINELMQSISEATVSQTDTSRTVTELMQQIAQQSQERLTSSQTVAQSMQETAQVAQTLEATVEQFKVS
ncbi:MAG: methyl-accepting chemotaxis protein [Crocosphaera sp.]|nr:methyl-accepting chemotaxis protein [Crocosphaera sp.]